MFSDLLEVVRSLAMGDGNVIYCSRCNTHFYGQPAYNNHPCMQRK